jgi:subtilisin family serine protease
MEYFYDKKYENSVSSFKTFLLVGGIKQEDIDSAKEKLTAWLLKLQELAQSYWEYQDVINYGDEILELNPLNATALINIGTAYDSLGNHVQALENYQKALNNTIWYPEKEKIKGIIYSSDYKYNQNKQDQEILLVNQKKEEEIKNKEKSIKDNAPTNDTYSYLQYYLQSSNIPGAWKKVTNSNEVIVAVIDDGVHINHPDLIDKIWSDKNAKYWASKIIDYVWDGLAANLPTWAHGTMVAGIIGAIQNNNKWIAGIAKNVKIMPIRVFGTDWTARQDSIVYAINYAVDKGANIINLSLW